MRARPSTFAFLFKKAISASIIISLLTAVGVSLLRAQITTLFGLTGSLAQQAQPALIITACSFLMVGITRCISAYFYAVEKTNVSTLLVYIEPCLFFPIALWTLPLFWGLNGVWAAYPTAQLALAVLCVALYIRWNIAATQLNSKPARKKSSDCSEDFLYQELAFYSANSAPSRSLSM